MSRSARAICSLYTLTTWCLLSIFDGPHAFAQDLVELVKKVEHAVVRIDLGDGFGSGVIVDNRGFVFTNYHVIEGATKATVTFRSGKKAAVQGYLAVDQSRDLAILKIDPLTKAAAISIATELPQVGEKVAAFGNPEGFSFTTSEGIVSALRPGKEVIRAIGEAEYRHLGYGDGASWVQTTAPISPGNSGGPLVNMKAQVVGLNTWHHIGQNLNFAISAAEMRTLLEKTNIASVLNLDSLPRSKQPSYDELLNPRFIEARLPNGRMFSMQIFLREKYPDRREQTESEKAAHVPIRQANGTLFAAATQKNGVLNGDLRAAHENLQLMLAATYQDGKRQGNLLYLEPSGRAKYYAQYAKGKRHGFACVFEKGTLAAIADYKYDDLVCIQMMKDYQLLDGFASAEEAQKDTQARKAIEAMDEVEAKLKSNDLLFRKQVASYESEQRKARAAALSPQKRDRTQARENARAAEEDAFLREMTRRAWQR